MYSKRPIRCCKGLCSNYQEGGAEKWTSHRKKLCSVPPPWPTKESLVLTPSWSPQNYPTVFALQKTSLTAFLQMSRQALGLRGERWKNGRKGSFFSEENNECLPNFEVFNENEFLETSSDLDDSEISSFIEENRNVNTTKKRQKLTSINWSDRANPLKKQGLLKKFPPRNLKIFYVISLSKSGNSTDSVFNNCTIVVGQKSPPLPLPKQWRVVDLEEDDWARSQQEVLAWLAFWLFVLSSSFFL